ncbi:hypothetical protein EV361DRAFT_808140 [Lentinula raphanica]|uniref:Uncharacterized protein n=1 Tax=Lentinula raphanica TaxID=153919 RepID=A0AA38P1W8_9AGAR|nr:hypothetical protein F5878DRAFT_630060 [Lentinula raphanica]KAJ3966951.1 hypothetical protein EV361DRAFT_808140 [Lentinula raphanica]
MPPRAKSGSAKSSNSHSSRALVSTGPKDVQNHYGQREDRQRELRPTTERALVLRNGKYGARGTGELILMTKLTGREKLDLLAEDLVEKTTKSIMTPLRMEECLKLAESQLSENLDDIANLKDSDLFFSIIKEEIISRSASDNKHRNEKGDDLITDPAYNAEIISNRIHNTYMLGSAWKIAVDLLYSLQEGGLFDDTVVYILRTNSRLRSQYLILYDLVNTLVDLQQKKFSLLATTTPHYASYFKEIVSETGEKEFVFDWKETRKACTSFLDSIIMELCFPRAPYPKAILYQILHDAVEERPAEARRFPQLLWDSVGDLSATVQLQQMLEAPLLSPDGKEWKTEARPKHEPYNKWVAAQLQSQIASDKWACSKDASFPLNQTKLGEALDILWMSINNTYKSTCSKDIDALWGLTEVLNPTPHWNSYGFVVKRKSAFDSNGGPPKSAGKSSRRPQITYGDDDDMPELIEVSESDSDEHDFIGEEDDDEDDDYDYDDDDDDEYSDDESEYDSDQEETIRDLVREAMDVVTAVTWEEPTDKNDELDPFNTEYSKGNSFLKHLSSLRGRMFSKRSKFSTATTSKEPPAKTPDVKPTTSAPADVLPDRSKIGVTIEEVSDEDNEVSHTKKKKKKKPKKKKKKPTATAVDGNVQPVTPETATRSALSPVPAASPAPVIKDPPKAPSPAKSKVAIAASQSTSSFYSYETATTAAQSARAYIHSENLDAPKTKVKSRSAQPSIFSSTKGLLNKFGVGKEKTKDTVTEQKEKRAWFSKLGKKTKSYMRQILITDKDDSKGGMKWEDFVKLMTDLGFEYVPSTAGSSVRFDPPTSTDRSISFHKPHPDSTISRVLLKEYSKKLRRYYGWEPSDLVD